MFRKLLVPTIRAVQVAVRPKTSVIGSRFVAVIEQKRYSQVENFGPFTPPKQLTFKEVETRVLKAIKSWDRFPQDKGQKLTLDAKFEEDLGIDSLDHVEIIMSLEDEFGFEIQQEDAEKLKSPRDVFKFICEREDVFE
uniref:Acyl carrier protein n=1 Tax=Rhabditophanes sp. KR3021 TaxID=114890 RepID=A0AC35TUH7_9BILA